MKTILFSSLVASGLLLVGTGAAASDSRSIVGDDQSSGHKRIEYPGGNHHNRPDYGPAISADAQAYDWGDDGGVDFAAPDGSSYSYDGEWDGEFVDPQGRVFEGEWQGTVTRHDGAEHVMSAPRAGPHKGAHHQAPAHDLDYDYRVPQDYERHEQRYERHVRAPYPSPRYQHGNSRSYQHGWQGGYYFYPQAVTVTVVSGAPVTTTTVTEEIYYETVHTAPRKRTIRKWKPKPKPRCVC